MTETFRQVARNKTFTIEKSAAGRSTFRVDGKRYPASAWQAKLNVAEDTDAWVASRPLCAFGGEGENVDY